MHPLRASVLGTVVVAAASVPAVVAYGDEGPLVGPATAEEINGLIRDLSDSSYATRQHATRRLCAVGMPAAESLSAAATGDDTEAALRAKAVLSALDRLMFAGVEVRLDFSRDRIVWDEPVDLAITMSNRSAFPARIPFTIDPAGSTSAGDDARQVGDMLDAADLLRVHRADGTRIDLTVDDISTDARVIEAVQSRLVGGPTTVLNPGQTMTVAVRAWNRGWARYRLLDADAYSVVLDYTPEWEDDVLAAQRIGHVVSNTAVVTVTKAAPPDVSRGGAEASLVLDQDGAAVVARLINRTDQTTLVNKNFGTSVPFAAGHWVVEGDAVRREIPVTVKAPVSWDDFDPALLAPVAAGESVELLRVSVDDLLRAMTEADAPLEGDRWTMYLSYANLCNRQWQARQGAVLLGNPKAPPIFREPLPRLILSTRQTSNSLSVPRRD